MVDTTKIDSAGIIFWLCPYQQNTNSQVQSIQRGLSYASTVSSTASREREVTCRVPQSLHSAYLCSMYSKLNWKRMTNKVMNVTNDYKHSTDSVWLCRVAERCYGIMWLIIKAQVKFNVD